jgi:hypothetical protein
MQQISPAPGNIFLCSLPFLSLFVFIYSGTFFAHVLTAFLVLSAFVLLRKKENYLLPGLLCGMAVLCEYPVFIIAAIWAIQILVNTKKIKPLLLFITGGLPFGIFLMIYNYKITGHPFEFLYSHQQNFPQGAENLGFAFVPKTEAMVQLFFGVSGTFYFLPSVNSACHYFFPQRCI